MVIKAENVKNIAKDAFYIALGFAVINFQKTQVRRQEAQKEIKKLINQLNPSVKTATEQVLKGLASINSTLSNSEQQLINELNKVSLLPEPVKKTITNGQQRIQSMRSNALQIISKLPSAS
jgi:uncharacterized membrane-anchored protein YhcB (DUF1043 family)